MCHAAGIFYWPVARFAAPPIRGERIAQLARDSMYQDVGGLSILQEVDRARQRGLPGAHVPPKETEEAAPASLKL